MVDTSSLEKYIAGRDALKAGDRNTALMLISESLGARVPTPYMESSIEALATPNPAALTLIIHESKRKADV